MAGPGGGRTFRLGLGTIGVAAAAIVAAIFLRGGGGSGSGGAGTGTGSNSATPSQTIAPSPPQRPLKVTIRENDYVVDGKPVDLVTLVGLADKVPPGSGAAVSVQRSPSSRAKAENDLKEALAKKGIAFTSD
jgi:hypothetical protein